MGKPGDDTRTEVFGLADSPALLPSPKERRLVHRFLYYWTTLRGDNPLPSIDDLDIGQLPASWENCFLITQPEAESGRQFDHLGRVFEADCGRKPLDPMEAVREDSLLDYATRSLPLVIAERVPTTTGGSLHKSAGRHIMFRGIALPFEGRASGNLYLLGAASWREDTYPGTGDTEALRCYKFDRGVWVQVELPAASWREPA